MTPDVSIIIVSWNVRDLLQKNLQRLFDLPKDVSIEVLVIDNGSEDGTPAMVREQFPQVVLFQNETNRGFAYACNQGLGAARGNVLILFNPDMAMGAGALEHTVKTLSSRPEIGVMGVSLTKQDGTRVESVRKDPGVWDQLAVLTKIAHLHPSVLDRYLAKDMDYTVSQQVEQVRGSYFAFRRDVYEKVGGLDAKRFFIWFEEVDFCKRAREAGYIIWYDATVGCTDFVGQSFKQQKNWVKQRWFSKSMARYLHKWHGWIPAAIVWMIRPVMIAIAAVGDTLNWKSSKWS